MGICPSKSQTSNDVKEELNNRWELLPEDECDEAESKACEVDQDTEPDEIQEHQTLNVPHTPVAELEESVVEEITHSVKAAAEEDNRISVEQMAITEEALAEQVEKAREMTKELMEEPIDGEKGDEKTVMSILGAFASQSGKEAVFFKGSECKDLPDSLLTPHVAFHDDSQKIDIRLESVDELLSAEDEKVTIEDLNNKLKAGESTPVLDEIRNRLARVHGVSPEMIQVTSFYEGSFGIVYCVTQLKDAAVNAIQTASDRLKNEFQSFVDMKIHPLFYRLHFNIEMFDERGHKDFTAENQSFDIAGGQQQYKQPYGWYRYGLKVLGGKYGADDSWLAPFNNNPNLWLKAYHGTGRARKMHLPVDWTAVEGADAKVKAIANIYDKGLHESKHGVNGFTAAYSDGVYCSPDVNWLENSGYCGQATIDTKNGTQNWKFLLMCAVRPGSYNRDPNPRSAYNDRIWVVEKKQDIRPYGLLVKRV